MLSANYPLVVIFVIWSPLFINNGLVAGDGSREAGGQPSSVSFRCPEQFGYYADSNNCSKYFVCVFGEALHEACTGGLRFSSELQTCDWPRNVVCPSEDSDTESQPKNTNTDSDGGLGGGRGEGDDTSGGDSLYDYNVEEIRQQVKNTNNQNEDNLRNIQNSFDNLLLNNNKNTNNRNNDNNNEDFLDLQRSRSVVNPQERGFGQQLIGRSVSGVRVTSVTSSTSDGQSFRDSQSANSNSAPKQSDPPKNNRVTVDDLNNPNFDEAIAAIIDENGGVHLNDGPGSLYAIVSQGPGVGPDDDKEVNVFVKPINSELKQNTRRGLAHNNHIILLNRTQLAIPQSTNNRGATNRFLPAPRGTQQTQYVPLQVPPVNSKPPELSQPQHRSNARTSRQRIHIIVNNRTQVQEIPIDDPIDFQRIPAIQQTTPSQNRYSNPRTGSGEHNRRPIPAPTVRTTTTEKPRRETPTERPQHRHIQHNPESSYVAVNERRQTAANARTVVANDYAIQPEVGFVPRDTVPQRPPPVYRTPEPYSTAMACNQKSCRLPDCFCAGTDIPGGLPVGQVPQIVLMTFDDAINDINFHIYDEIFQSHRTNPNGCPIRATFYVSHEWTDYGQVQTLYSRGHELASHSVTHSFGERFSKSQWNKEINGQREILHLYGGVNLEDIRGMRAPFLQGGGNKQFEMLYEANFTYDSTMPVFENNPPYWPFTLDFASNHECMIAPCPTKSFPGFWEIGMVMWQDLRGGRCSMGDACSNPTDENGVFEMIMKNFNRHYQSNRAPFGLYYHSAWFNTDHHKRGFIRVIDELLKRKDVYFMTKWQAIQWMRNPKPVHELYKSQSLQCGAQVWANRPPPCLQPNICNVGSKSGSRFLKTCQPCPLTYPWVGNTGFAKS